MTPFQALMLGLVQGLTEFLPISSSGHLVVGQHILGFTQPPVTFDIFLHLATALAIMVFFWRQLCRPDWRLWQLIVLATIPAGIVGLVLNNYLVVIFSSVKLVAAAWLYTGMLLLLARYFFRPKRSAGLTPKRALLIGLFQAIAIIPGVSRSGSTISAGLLSGLSPGRAFEFSFLMALPAILGAAVLQFKDWQGVDAAAWPLAIGMAAAFISGYLSLVWLKRLVARGHFTGFAVYCLILGFILLIF